MIVLFIKYATIGSIGQLYAQELMLSPTGQAYISTVFATAQMVAGFLAGTFFARRFGTNNTLLSGLLLTAISLLMIGLIPDAFVFFIAYGLNGFGFGITYNVLMAMSIDQVPQKLKATYMGVFQTIYAIGIFAGPIVALTLNESAGSLMKNYL